MRQRASAEDLRDGVHSSIAAYYSRKIAKYGATPLGVDWSCTATQELRFEQLLRICDFSSSFSLNDVGCGFGALVGYLARRHPEVEVDYLGVDLSREMIVNACQLWKRRRRVKFALGGRSPRVADYSLASGIFNVKLAQPRASWELFVIETLAEMRTTSRRGFAVNFIAPRTPSDPLVPELYRVTPGRWIRRCERELGVAVELVNGYGLREFTLLIRPRPSPAQRG